MAECCRAAASRLADKKEEGSYSPPAPVAKKPSLQKTSSSRRTIAETDHASKAAAFLLKNPNASVSMLKRSPSSQKTMTDTESESSPPTQGEIGASPFEYNQGRFSNEPILGGDESPTHNPLLRIPEGGPLGSPRLQELSGASSGELSTRSSAALLGHHRG